MPASHFTFKLDSCSVTPFFLPHPPPLQLHAFNDHNSLVPVPLDDAAAGISGGSHHTGCVSLEVVGAPPPLVLLR